MRNQRTLIRVDISIDQSWAIGAPPDLHFRANEQTTRLPVQRNPLTETIQLPATSLVGSLRRHLDTKAEKWLGSEPGADTMVSSELRCLATIVHAPKVGTRTTTAIDPERRAAAAHMLREEELVQPTVVSWWLEWDHHDKTLTLDDLIRELRGWHPVVGRRRSANRGRAHVKQIFYRTIDLETSQGLTWWLKDRHEMSWMADAGLPSPDWTQTQGKGIADNGEEVIKRSFRVVDALHVGGRGNDAWCADCAHDPDRADNRKCSRDEIPSTSWRGVFRNRVAHIIRVRTEGTEAEVEKLVDETLSRLFGSAREQGRSDAAGHRGRLRFGDSRIVGARHRRTHVAIDRISGGAALRTDEDPRKTKGLLFEVCHFGPGARVELIVYNDSSEPVCPKDVELLEHVIRDIGDGMIGIGGMTSRGYGTLTLEQEQP